MTARLLDVNVLVALAWPNHVHHARAHAWFRRARDEGWATCPLTQSGFVRVSSNVAAIPDARTPAEARALLREMVKVGRHVFWSDDVSAAATGGSPFDRVIGYRQMTDAHLLALALRRGGVLATLDRNVRDLLPSDASPENVVDAVEVIA